MILFVNACARKESRTRKLAESYLDGIKEPVRELNLYEEEIPLLTETAIVAREKAAIKFDTTDRFVELAKEFSKASKIVIAAPYWDMGYPAILRSYLEAIMVKGITFRYDNEGKAMGLCLASEIIYITTAGGRIIKPNLGLEHIKSLATQMLGIPRTFYFEAEGLDVVGVDINHILEEKMDELKRFRETREADDYERNTIMIVDDSKVNILKAEHILKENGYNVINALSGQACLKLLKTKMVDLILLDIEMPGFNGFETLEALRADNRTKDIPVVFVTGDKTMDVVVKASSYKAAGYVTKPFGEEELLKHVQNGILKRNTDG